MPHYFFDTDNGSEPRIVLEGRELLDDAAARWADSTPSRTWRATKSRKVTIGRSAPASGNSDDEVIYAATLAMMGGWKKRH